MNTVSCLLIDDDTDDHEIFKLALDAIDSTILCVCLNRSMQAIEKLKSDRSFLPKIIFVDINMPVMNGVECLAEIKKIEHLKDVPVVFYSTFADSEKISEMKQLGAAEYFEKPADLDVLIHKLSSIFKTYKFLS
ncbi:MAG TPA: response regulator [Parafilimonas sp.]|nr:response regulator [Parafilimonas sp.]